MDLIQIVKFLGFVVEGILVSDALPAQLIRGGYGYWTIVFVTTLFNAAYFAGVIGLIISRHWVAKLVKNLRAKLGAHQDDSVKKTSNRWQEFLQKIKPRWVEKIQQRNGVYKRRILRALKTGGYVVLVIAGAIPYISGIATVFIGLNINRNTWNNRKWRIITGYFSIVIGSSLRMMLLTYYPVIDLPGWWEYLKN